MTRSEQDRRVIESMIRIYCRGHHTPQKGALCQECDELLLYASKRLKKCPIEESKKNSCRLCKIHCFDHSHSQRMREVMRYSGARMLLRNPIMVIRHFINERK